jgi:type II secretory pathway pseudopilin PulG
VVAVLIILGILSAVAISRGMSSEEARLQAEVDTLKAHLRYAQYLALNENDTNTTTVPGTPVKWGIQINGSSYTLVKVISAAQTSLSPLPGESSATHSFATGITAALQGSNPILFDEWGSPYFASNKLIGNGEITIITLAPGSQSIKMYAETGYIP